MAQIIRKKTVGVNVGGTRIGAEAPIVVQSMTDTNTEDPRQTAQQIAELALAGSELVRVTVNTPEAAKVVPEIIRRIEDLGLPVPIVGDFHYNGHILLSKHPDCARSLAKYRINPGNVGVGKQHDENFRRMIDIAIENDKPVRIGVNWGSLDQGLLTRLMDQNTRSQTPKDSRDIVIQAMTLSAIESAESAEGFGLRRDHIILSAKVSEVQDLIEVYRELSKKSEYALHVGLTEAGLGSKGIIASTAALSVLLQEGIGDTIRISLTPSPGSPRTEEVVVAQQILQSLGIRSFTPQVSACPGCGRTSSGFFQEMADQIQTYLRDQMPKWRGKYRGVEGLKVAVMGCVVNGPGESKHANIGISLPGRGEIPKAPVYINGKLHITLKGANIVPEFKKILAHYVDSHYTTIDPQEHLPDGGPQLT